MPLPYFLALRARPDLCSCTYMGSHTQNAVNQVKVAMWFLVIFL